MANSRPRSDEPTFEQSLADLEKIVDELEAGDLGLGQALEAYELGIKHLKLCHKLLEQAERRIELLSGVDANGNPIAEPFEEHFTSDLTEQATSRTRKRTSPRNSRPADVDICDPLSVDDPERLF